MTTRLSRERAVTSALDHLHTHATELARFASKVADPATPSGIETSPVETSSVETPTVVLAPGDRRTVAGQRARAYARRSARAARWRRVSAGLGAMVFAGLASTTLVSSAATAGTDPAPNSVLAFGSAPNLGPDVGLVLRAGVVGMASDPAAPGYWLAASDGGVFAFGDAAFQGSKGGTPLNAQVVGIAATPDGRGYWLVGSDGGVFAFGDATYFGSMAGTKLRAPVTAIVATRDGGGYWLVASDGGVFAFGDATYFGSADDLELARPIIAAAVTNTGSGYWLLGSDGGVFTFGDAHFFGAQPDPAHPAVGIAVSPDGPGYLVARTDGSVTGFGAAESATTKTPPITGPAAPVQTVGIAASSNGGYWLAQGAPTASTLSHDPFLACTRAHESDRAGGYHAVSPGGAYRGAYQFDRGTWNNASRHAGRTDLVGADPATVSPADQDLVAMDLFHMQGTQPWGGRCRGLS